MKQDVPIEDTYIAQVSSDTQQNVITIYTCN